MTDAKRVRCAIYTRKSSEEGLDQSFNSLHAQREACEAFIVSQRHEGWHALSKHYDDGGFSGGNMERPALTDLLSDIEQGKVDTVVVYKVDRLTRSLSDFAKIIERFDRRSVSFVSVTQQFNTTSSMGRLTLNVLLSFAQFEREVTGERIRDKIAASKRKGMWMGGIVSLGYDLKNRQLLVNEKEAESVRYIFKTYLRLRCVSKLKSNLDERGIRSKGGKPFSRGALYHLLRNRLYIGEIPHKGEAHKAQHAPIISTDLWNRVDAALKTNINGERLRVAKSPSLAGLIFDEEGNRYTPTHSTKVGKRYRYYTSQGAIRKDRSTPKLTRIPAHELEQSVIHHISQWIKSAEFAKTMEQSLGRIVSRQVMRSYREYWDGLSTGNQLLNLKAIVKSITVSADHVHAQLKVDEIPPAIGVNAVLTGQNVDLEWAATLAGSSSTRIDHAGARPAQVSTALIKLIARAYLWADGLQSGEIKGLSGLTQMTGINRRYTAKVLKACALAPELIEAALQGRQPAQLTAQSIIAGELPLSWEKQRLLFGRDAV